MTLKPNRPWLELVALGLILYFTVKFILLAIEKNDLTIIIPSLVFLTIGILATVWTNKEYRTYDLTDRLKFSGQFWGRSEIEIKRLTGFRIKERKNTTNLIPFSEFDIVIEFHQSGELTIRETNYNSDNLRLFKDRLENKGVTFLGTVNFSWAKSFRDLIKLK